MLTELCEAVKSGDIFFFQNLVSDAVSKEWDFISTSKLWLEVVMENSVADKLTNGKDEHGKDSHDLP